MKTTFVALSMFFLVSASAWSCELCCSTIYNSPFVKSRPEPGFFAGAFEQYVYASTLRDNGTKIANTLGQYMHSSNTQFVLGYQFSEVFSVHVNIPYIVRAYARAEGAPSVLTSGSEDGIGDISLLALFRLWQSEGNNWAAYLDILGGLKFASGSSSRLQEELNALPDGPGVVASGIHGHDLALGSGSTDAVLGISTAWSLSWLLATASLQYTLRSPGSVGYRYANDLNWKFSPGAYLLRTREHGLALTANLSGQYKGLDALNGAQVNDTGLTTVFIGAGLTYKWGECIYAELASDFPILESNTSIKILPDVRARAGLVFRF